MYIGPHRKRGIMMPVYADDRQPENELHKLLLKAVPLNNHGNKSLYHLAKLMECRRWSIYKWITAQKLSPARATQLVEIGKLGVPDDQPGRVTIEEFHPFVYKD